MDSGFWILDPSLDSGFWILDLSLDSGFWIRVWILDSGCLAPVVLYRCVNDVFDSRAGLDQSDPKPDSSCCYASMM